MIVVNKEGLRIRVMEKSVGSTYKWPKRDDILQYQFADVRKIGDPIQCSAAVSAALCESHVTGSVRRAIEPSHCNVLFSEVIRCAIVMAQTLCKIILYICLRIVGHKLTTFSRTVCISRYVAE